MTEPATPLAGTPALGRQLMDAFAKGWSKADLDLIMSVFGEQATFLETPFAPAHVGVDAIRRYWADVPYHQSEITVTSGEIFSVGPWFSTEFKSVFRRRRTGEWVEARGAIFCETDGGKITEMRMYWHRQR
jgi:ketosteroid isomerase-like protein